MGNVWQWEKRYRGIAGVVGVSLVLALVAGCGDSNSGGGTPAPATPAAGTVTGQVVSLANNAPVNGATVKTDTGTATTTADGKFSVSAPAGDRTIVNVEATGFAEAFPIARVTSGQTTNLGVKLVPIGVTETVSIAAGGTVSVPNSPARVTIPANALVPQAGGTAAGSVNVSVTPINPVVDTSLMPGGFNGISAGGGTTRPIESFGAMLIDIRDSGGTQYTLASGKTATIRIPVGTQSTNLPATVPLWFFDETAGVWREERTATLQGTGGNQYYEGAVSRVTYWNADVLFESMVVNGCVKDANSQPVANALVQTEGIDYTGTAFDSTAADGTFSVAMRKSSQANLRVVESNPQTFALVSSSNIVKVGPSATDVSLTNCLVKQPGPLTITATALPGGTVGAAYNQTLTASGGVPGYVWSLNAGSNQLPAGVTLNPAGVLSGTPTADGTTAITLKVTDSTGAAKTKEFTLAIQPINQPLPPPPPPSPALSITTAAVPGGRVGTAYNATVEATGGTGNRTWSVSAGTLPAGLTLNTASGVISGTPTTAGTSTATIRVVDTGTPQQSTQKDFTVAITGTTPPPPPSCGAGLTNCLTVSNVPLSLRGGTFVPDPTATKRFPNGTTISVNWAESLNPNTYLETLFVSVDQDKNVAVVNYAYADRATSGGWQCATNPFAHTVCPGLSVDRSAGTASFGNTVLLTLDGGAQQSVTLNGTLTFTPF